MMEPGAKIVDTARSFVGTKFVHQGRMPGVGLDCIGLITCVARALDIPHHDDVNYSRRPEPGRLREGLLASGCFEIPAEERRHGDILTFWFCASRHEQHVGILATDRGRETLIHTLNRGMRRAIGLRSLTGAVVEHGLDDFWKERIVTAWRYGGIA